MEKENAIDLRFKSLAIFTWLLAWGMAISTTLAQTYVNRVSDGQGGYSLTPVKITGAVTWPATGSPYILEGWDWNLVVESGATLRIEAGTVISVPASRDGGAIEVKGTLHVLGTAVNPVVFKRNEAEGSWSGLRFMDGSQGMVQYAVLEDSGHQSVGWQAWHPGAAIYAQNAAPAISHTTIRRSNGHGIGVSHGASPTVEDCLIEQSTRHAIIWQSFWTNATPVFRRNRGTGNHWDAIYINNGTLSGRVTLAANDLPYCLQGWDGHLIIDKPGVLEVEPGVIVKSGYGRDGGSIVVRGQMNCNGTSTASILFTSEYDDTLMGDTNQDGTQTTAYPGAWSGIRFQDGGTGTWKFTVIRAAGHISQGWQGWHPAASFYITDSSPRLEQVTVERSQGRGLSFARSRAEIINCTIQNSGGAAIGFEADGLTALPDFTGTSAQGNSLNGITLTGVTGTLHLPNYQLPYVVYDWLVIPTNAVVGIDPGALIMFAYQDNNSYKCGIRIQGRLLAVGTSDQPIRFTSVNDAESRPGIRPSTAQVAPAPGDWNGLYFEPDSTGEVSYCDLFYAGYLNANWNFYGGGAISLNRASPRVTHNLIWKCGGVYSGDSGHGLRLENSASVVESNTVDSAAGYAFSVIGNVTAAFPSFRGNTATNCGLNGIRLPAQFDINAQLDDAGIPYITSPAVLISTNVTVRAAAGTIIKFGETDPVQGRMWTVHGRFEALGTPSRPVVMTSLRDDAAGGDTNNDQNRTAPLGTGYADWASLTVRRGGFARLTSTTLRYGGYLNGYWSQEGGGLITLWEGTVEAADCAFLNPGKPYTEVSRALYQRGGALTLKDCRLEGGEYGLQVIGGTQAVLMDCRIIGQKKFGVSNSSELVVDARDTWWGDASGPLDSDDDRATGGSYNPQGKGVAVSNRVLYTPWKSSTGEQIILDIYTAVELEFPTRAGSLYVIQASEFSGGPWIGIGEPIPGTGQPVRQLLSTLGQSKRFYRVQLVVP